VQRALVIARTKFRVLDATRLLALVLGRRVITHFALGAFECYDISHCRTPSKTLLNISDHVE
jgi:hypothetical protein